MAKRKAPKSSDQPELPLGDAPESTPKGKSRKSASKGTKAGGKAEVTPLKSAAALLPVEAQAAAGEIPEPQPKGADLISAPAEPPPPPPKRRGGDNVQTEDSPLAKAYRGWFLEYASYVI